MYARSTWTLVMLLSLLAVPAVMAQGTEADDPDEGGSGGFGLEFGTWVSQASGHGLVAATGNDPTNPFATRPITPDLGTETEFYYALSYEMPRNLGKFSFWLYDHGYDDVGINRSEPGNYRFGEVLAHPLFAGVNLDGLADAFSAEYKMDLKDTRLDYGRKAFQTSRVEADWFVGWRRVKHLRKTDAVYSGLISPLPPLLPPLTSPRPELDPADDIVNMQSDYNGRGLEVGMNFRAPLVTNLMTLEAGIAIAALRGKTNVSYSSTTHYYVLTHLDTSQEIIGPPYDELNGFETDSQGVPSPNAERTSQRNYRVGLTQESNSTSSMVLETYLAIRWKIIKGLTAVTGFKQIRYDNVATELRPEITTSATGLEIIDGELVGVNSQNFSEIERSATYEGFYFGVGYQF